MPHVLQHLFENNPGLEEVSMDLEEGPLTVYITNDGEKLYVLLRGHIVCFIGPPWGSMDLQDLHSAVNFAVDVELCRRREAERIRNGGTVSIVCKECWIPLQKNPFTSKYTCFVHGKR